MENRIICYLCKEEISPQQIKNRRVVYIGKGKYRHKYKKDCKKFDNLFKIRRKK